MRVGVHCGFEECGDTRLWVADVLECDAGELLSAQKNARAKMAKTLESRGQGLALVSSLPLAEAEDWKLLRELAEASRAEAVTLKLGKAQLSDRDFVGGLIESIHRWKDAGDESPPLFVDPGEGQTAPSGLSLALDPFMAEDPSVSPYWRVSAASDVRELSKLVLMDLPDWVILAYPGRFDDLSPLKSRLF